MTASVLGGAPLDVVVEPGVTLRGESAGPADGPPTLLLHGFPESRLGWRLQFGPLATAGLRVAAPDQRGYGDSDKPRPVSAYRVERLVADALAVLDALGADRARVVGHDWGALVAWCLAAWHPERVERLAVLNVPHPDVMRRRSDDTGIEVDIREVELSDAGNIAAEEGRLNVVPVRFAAEVTAGELNPANAPALLDGLRIAVSGCLDGTFAGLVTAPLQKSVSSQRSSHRRRKMSAVV